MASTDFIVKNGLIVGGSTGTGFITAAGATFSGNVTAGSLSASTLSGDGSALLTNFTLSAGGDIDNVTTSLSALNGTFTLPIELKDTGVSAGSYGSNSSIPTFTVDDDGRLTAAGSATIATTLSTAGDTGSGSVDLLSDIFTIGGTANEIVTVASGTSITISLPDDVTIGNDLTVTGNLTVNGNTTTQNVSTVLVEDPVIKLANGNSADILDIGFYGQYNDGSTKYTGLIRDISHPGGETPYVFFDGTTTDILSANASGAGKPDVANYADVYLGRIGINTSDYNANNRLTIVGDTSAAGSITVKGNGLFVHEQVNGLDDVFRAKFDSGRTGILARYSTDQTNLSLSYDTATDATRISMWAAQNGGQLYVKYATGDNLFVADANSLSAVQIGGGYGDTGVTISTTGNLSADGEIVTHTLKTITTLEVLGNLEIGGGYGDTGVTITSAGSISADGGVYADSFYSKSGGQAIDFNDNISLLGTFTTTGQISGASTLFIDGNSVLRGTVQIDGDTTIGSNRIIFVDDDATAGSVQYNNNTTAYHSTSATIADSASAALIAIPMATYRTAKIIIQAVGIGGSSSHVESSEILMIHDGTSAYTTEYGIIKSGNDIGTYTGFINGTDLELRATNGLGASAAFTVSVQHLMA